MADLNKVAVRLPFGLPGFAEGSTCSLPRSRAEALARRGLAIILEDKVETESRFGDSFRHKLNRITKTRTKARKKRHDARVEEERKKNEEPEPSTDPEE